MISLFFTHPIEFIVAFGGLLLSLSFHEFMHAFVADRLGDPTPRIQGRVTVNPLAHLDPLGTLALLLTHFGWGKPVEIDPYNFKNPVRDSALVAAAGPVSNLVVAFVSMSIARFIPLPTFLSFSLAYLGNINIVLAIFNLVPVYPLDGSRVLTAILPRQVALEYEHFMHRYGIFVLLGLIIPWANGSAPIVMLIEPIINVISKLFFPSIP